MAKDTLTIGGKTLNSRLFIGTGKFPDKRIVSRVLEKSQCEVVTIALRRVDPSSQEENILDYIPQHCIRMPNTSGARTAEEAVRIARLAKASGCGDWIKIEVINDNRYLLPDNFETLKATEILAGEGFTVLPYMSPDLSAARRMVKAGAAAIMPLGAPIGSNRGLKTKELVRIMTRELKVPVIVDAGLGRPSQAALCMEMGCAAVLVNTAIATAPDPIRAAQSFALAVQAGRLAYTANMPLAEIVPQARASSPLTGFLDEPKKK